MPVKRHHTELADLVDAERHIAHGNAQCARTRTHDRRSVPDLDHRGHRPARQIIAQVGLHHGDKSQGHAHAHARTRAYDVGRVDLDPPVLSPVQHAALYTYHHGVVLTVSGVDARPTVDHPRQGMAHCDGQGTPH